MNAEQKQRALAALGMWHSSNDDSLREYQAAELMAGLLQDLVDAPTPEPFGYFKAEPFGWTDCAETDDGAIALFAAPPAPSVPDVELVTVPRELLGAACHAINKCLYAPKILEQLRRYVLGGVAAPTPAEAPADVARDAGRYRWLREKNAELGRGFYVGDDTDKEPGDITWIGSDLDAAIDAAMREKGGA